MILLSVTIICYSYISQTIKLLQIELSAVTLSSIVITHNGPTYDNSINDIYCSCIKTARNEGINIPYNTDAKDLIPNTTPAIDKLVILQYNNVYHVAVIKEYSKNGFIILEGNKTHCVKDIRLLQYNDPHIKGFWKHS